MARTTPAKQYTPDVDQPAIAVKVEGDDAPVVVDDAIDDAIDDAVDDVDELEEEESHGAEDSLEQDHLPAPRKKRARPNPSKPKAPRKRYVRGKQGGLKGLMKMPIEIFTEIASHLLPGDLVVLTRSNKFFRKILLQRSAIQMWRRAESSVPGLPPCPPYMCEPQYAALIFSKHCTLCGAAATARPDTALLVRLCASCRDTKLKEVTVMMGRRIIDLNLVCYSNVLRPKTIQNNYRGSNHPVFSLSQDVDEVLNKQQEFLRAEDKQGLAKWESERKLAVTARRQQSVPLGKYLSSVDISRGQALTDVKQARRQSIRERLEALGWTDQDMRFVHSDSKPWNTLVDAPKPLTDRIWTNILPKLTPLLQQNRDAHLAFAQKERRIARRKHVDAYLTQMKYAANIFEPIFNALGAEIPPPPPLNEVFNCLSPIFSYKVRGFLYFEQPFPSTCTALKWECLNDLGERDITLDEVDAELAARRSQIEEKITEWRADTERRLVEKFESRSKKHADDIIVKVKGSTELTDRFSRDTRLLLRADTIFHSNGSKSENSDDSDLEAYGWGVASEDSYICYYPNIITSSYDYFQESPYYCASENPEESFEGYARHTKAEKVVKALLKEMGMPDVARIELQLMKSRFLCGRCSGGPKSWDEMVKHYRLMLKTWEAVKSNTGIRKIRHSVVFRNIHDLESPNNPKPIVRIISEMEATAMAQPSLFSQEESLICHLCDQTGKRKCRLRQEDMLVHMQDVHDVGEPVEGLHYGAHERNSFDGKWQKEWDAFHDARENALVGAVSSTSDTVPQK